MNLVNFLSLTPCFVFRLSRFGYLKMQYKKSVLYLIYVSPSVVNGFAPSFESFLPGIQGCSESTLFVSIGLGPGADEDQIQKTVVETEDLPEPDHELFRDSRLSDFDKKCDAWYGSLLSGESFLGAVSEEASRRINTLVKLERQVRCDMTI